jgi:hypothetical protein
MREEINELDLISPELHYNVKTMHGKMESVLGFRLKALGRFIQKRIQPPACWDDGLFIILSSYWLFVEKIRQSATYFGLDCGFLVFFKYSTYKP